MTEELFQEIKNTESRIPGSPSLGKRGLGGVPSHDSAFTIHDSIHIQPWPKYDETLVKEEVVTMVVQINGKTRDSVQIDSQKGNNEEAVKQSVLQSARVQKWLESKKIKKTIFVQGRIINFVV